MPSCSCIARLMTVLHERLGHALVGAGRSREDRRGRRRRHHAWTWHAIEPGCRWGCSASQALAALDADMQRIVDAADETAAPGRRGPRAGAMRCIFTGGSTGLASLAQRIAARFPAAGGARRPLRQRRAGAGRARVACLRRARFVAGSRRPALAMGMDATAWRIARGHTPAPRPASILRRQALPSAAHIAAGAVHGGHGLRLGRQRLHRRLPDPLAGGAGLDRAPRARPGARSQVAQAAGGRRRAAAGSSPPT